MPANSSYVGVSNAKGFRPMGEHHLPPSSVEGKIPCILTGKGIDRPTTVYVRPGRVRFQIEKYKGEKQTLTPPKTYDLDEEIKAEAEAKAKAQALAISSAEAYVPIPRPLRKATARPVICLNTGTFFDSVLQVSQTYKLSTQIINHHLSGQGKQAKGRRLRYATPEEIEQADQDMNWKYTGELLPLVSGKRNF